jgi:beta-lactamase regulating signal transducer with metallopeptidase domain
MILDAATAMTWLADHSLRVAALVVVVGAGSLLAPRASAHSRLFAWTVVLYAAIAMPLLANVLPDVPVPVAFGDPVIVVPTRGPAVIEPALQANAGHGASQSSSAVPWLVATYLTIAGFLLTRVLAGILQTTRVLRRAEPIADTTLLAEVYARSSAMRVSRMPGILQHASVHVPFVCGLLRPALVVPVSWKSWDSNARHAILTHELSHIARRDLWTMRAASLYRAITWISPMSWWLRRRLETETERASDEAVLATGVEPTAYAEILVQFFDAA